MQDRRRSCVLESIATNGPVGFWLIAECRQMHSRGEAWPRLGISPFGKRSIAQTSSLHPGGCAIPCLPSVPLHKRAARQRDCAIVALSASRRLDSPGRMKRARSPDAVGCLRSKAPVDRLQTRGVHVLLCGIRPELRVSLTQWPALQATGRPRVPRAAGPPDQYAGCHAFCT